MNIVGPIQFETMGGHQSAAATYTTHPALRPFQIAFRGIWHVQNRCDAGVWVYRAVSDAPGTCGTDPAVKVE